MTFFERLRVIYADHAYDPDLIINVDETTTTAEKTKRSTRVFYDPEIDIRPMAKVAPKMEHITLCCGIAASGKALMPVFIIKNKHINAEEELNGELFDYGTYALCWSQNGWQEAVM